MGGIYPMAGPSIVICSEREKLAGLGEDSFSYSFDCGDTGYISVFDGCGGMGAKKYPKVGNRSGARVASRLAAYVTDKLYEDKQFLFDGNDCQRLKERLTEEFAKIRNTIETENGLKLGGDLFKTMPTTASIAAVKNNGSSITCEFFWAGDSRGYFLDADGLCQVTKDDIKTDEDAFTNLRSDGRMSNVIHAEGDFSLNTREIEISQPAMIITSTDGGFGYYGTPMDFEYIILSSLMESDSPEEWENKLSELIIPVTGDDFAVGIAVYGLDDIADCREHFKERCQFIKESYIDPVGENADEEQLLRLWQKYKPGYYRR
jgi:serine/threonine protein phosphatase PrpC